MQVHSEATSFHKANYIMKRKIIAFLVLDKATGKKVRAQDDKFDIFTASDGRTYAVAIVEGFYDDSDDTIYEDKACSVWGDAKYLKDVLKVGRKLYVTD